MKLLLTFILIILLSTKIQTQKSLFDSIDSPSQSKNSGGSSSSSGKEVLSSVLSKLKNEIKTPLLKDNLTPEGIAKFISNTLSGNQFINNLQVKDNAELHHVEVLDSLKVNGKATFDSLQANKIITPSITLDDTEAVIDSNTLLKLAGNDVSFKVGDVFEAITFTKYIVSICGDKLDKCDFGMLMKNRKKKEEPKMKSVVIASPVSQESEPRDMPMFKEKAMENEIKIRIDKEYEEYKKSMEKLNRNNNNDLLLTSTDSNIYNDPSYVNLLNSYYYSNGFLNSNMPITNN